MSGEMVSVRRRHRVLADEVASSCCDGHRSGCEEQFADDHKETGAEITIHEKLIHVKIGSWAVGCPACKRSAVGSLTSVLRMITMVFA